MVSTVTFAGMAKSSDVDLAKDFADAADAEEAHANDGFQHAP